ncbi:17132_t:CDS:1, partial [Gigaspora margarita]
KILNTMTEVQISKSGTKTMTLQAITPKRQKPKSSVKSPTW